jgi:hypothetical protein
VQQREECYHTVAGNVLVYNRSCEGELLKSRTGKRIQIEVGKRDVDDAKVTRMETEGTKYGM